MSAHKEINLSKITAYSISERQSKVESSLFAKKGKVELSGFLDVLPEILSAKDLKELITAIRQARDKGKAIILGIGGHVIKCGLAPLIIELMEAGYVSAIAVNGSVIVHDYEIAFYGQTSEDVSKALADGSFGMAFETSHGINTCITEGSKQSLGLGEAVGKAIHHNAPNAELSVLGKAYEYGIPLTVHVAIGTDIIHQSPFADGKAIGDCSMRDFRIFCNQVTGLDEGGVYLNFGSAVILPEVFLKALTVARNITGSVKNFSTAVFDMNQHYRARVNVMQRPVETGGKGYYFIGQHEVLIPLLIKSVLY
ncbi:MAG: deoxyhypusine synthase family protein [Candidatus Cloacimonadaceae bacterium]|nr:deoxyhypusine synthase family protein [Candidatus Cloacimonadota bacterium]MCB5254253.1 deoxyhypusine synthase family protein [Candidatus Cloacimonadota bacterium]MCK9178803.1 deoxyhypusine synthase family protein [Candidatus Cloacimonadota bacterium]MCK9243324.1 deoxyhypusine synthase family protein [Candidatus Cloacimonadota bacterium]MDY0128326.1 deoxyhypusine synthase family protein [Candidatus Cloacimonadaceae bacterium]